MTFHKFAVGGVLAVAMVGVLGASAIMFSARDFQFGVAQVAPSTNGRVDFAALESVEGEIAALRGQPDQEARVQTLQAQIVPPEHYVRIRNEAASLQSLSVFGLSAYLAQGHPALLSIMLVLLMGALGSLLYLFPAYLNRPAPVTMAEIFVRLIFGMCAALATYVLANALATFSVSAPTQAVTTTSATLNPFTVSLIGILAGVMSEDIAKWIQERGRGVLGGGAAARPAAAPPPEPAPTGGLVNNEAIR